MKCISQILSFFLFHPILMVSTVSTIYWTIAKFWCASNAQRAYSHPAATKICDETWRAPRYVPLQEFEEIKATVKQEAGCRKYGFLLMDGSMHGWYPKSEMGYNWVIIIGDDHNSSWYGEADIIPVKSLFCHYQHGKMGACTTENTELDKKNVVCGLVIKPDWPDFSLKYRWGSFSC